MAYLDKYLLILRQNLVIPAIVWYLVKYFFSNLIRFSFFFSESNTIQKPVEVVIQDESRLNELGYCPGTTSRNVEWNWTKPGETAILPCPLGKYIIH